MACITGSLAAIGEALFGGGAAATAGAGLTAADLGLGAFGLAAPSTVSALTAASLPGALAGLGGVAAGAAAGAIPGIIDATAGAIPEQVLINAPYAAAASSGIDPIIAGIGGAGGALSTLAGTPMDASPYSAEPIDNTAGMTPEQVTITAPQPDIPAPGSTGLQPIPLDPFSIDLPMDQVNNLTAPATQSTWGDSLMGDVAHVGESLGINSALRYILGGGAPVAGVPGGGGSGTGGSGTGGSGGGGAGGGASGGNSGVPGGQQDFSGSSGALSRASGTAAKGLSNTALTLGALAALGSAFGRPKVPGAGTIPGPASTAATRGPLFSAPLTTGAFNRAPVQNYMPAGGSYYTYGNFPQSPFFTGNQVTLPGFNQPGFAGGGAISRHMRERPFATAKGEHFVRGPGTGTSDSVPARLSDGEYVLTAADVARIGGGSNEAGARKLDRARTQLARSTSGKIMHKPKGAGFLARASR